MQLPIPRVTEFNLRLFVMLFVLRDRHLARTACSYVSGVVSVSRTTFPSGTILPERLTVLNRWVKKLERFDTYDTRHAHPLSRVGLLALWQGLDLTQTPLLQLFVMCLVSFQAALRSDNAAHGIKLKHVEYSKTPSEFSMTPYEMLMDDIRSAKVKLNPVEARPRPVQRLQDSRSRCCDHRAPPRRAPPPLLGAPRSPPARSSRGRS